MSPSRSTSPSSAPATFIRLLLTMTGGVILFVVLLIAIAVGYSMVYYGTIYPGVSVFGVDVSGLTPDQAAERIQEELQFAQKGRIVFLYGDQVWIARPNELGMYLDSQATALAAYSVGRQGDPVTRVLQQFRAWYYGIDLPPLAVYEESRAYAYVNQIAEQINKPTIEANLEIRGLEVVATPGQVGLRVDVPATLAPLQDQLRSFSDGILGVAVAETPPLVADVSAQAEAARKILSQPLTITLPDAGEGDPGPWIFEPEKLASMLAVERVETEEGAQLQLRFKSEELKPFLQGLAPQIARDPENARYIFKDDTRQLEVIQSAKIGRRLNIDASIQAINEGIASGEHTISLVVNYQEPEFGNDVRAADLGITELVSSHTSYFYGSGASRIQNIHTAASRFHGVLVPPGATFSMAEVLGDISLDNGYAEALIIYGDRTIEGVGGGVCQVSTTLFRTAFFGGYPILERYPHAYRVGYYEQTASGGYDPSLAGLDATVFVPVVDFKFKNDTPYYILMETYYDNVSLTWKFYSTSDGRTVEWHTSGLKNVTPPPEPVYNENPKLAKGEIKKVDYEVEGADVSIVRRVYRNGELYLEDNFVTHYVPWQAVYEYGPGTKIPKNRGEG